MATAPPVFDPAALNDVARAARVIARGVERLLAEMGAATLTEFTLRSGRRVDIMALDPDGGLRAIEIKSGIVDFRSDAKWPEYREYCDRFYFAVAESFPQELIPDDCGLIVADAWGAELVRESPLIRLAGARRKAQTLKFARLAAQRLLQAQDPWRQT